MSTQLTRDTERRSTLAQIAELDITRHLLRSGASHLDAATVWTALAEIALRHADQRAAAAVDDGESYADVARALDISRQAATKRYRHLRSVG